MLTEESRALQEGATPLLDAERHAPHADARAAAADAHAEAAAAAAAAAEAEAEAGGGGTFSTALASFFAAGESVGDSVRRVSQCLPPTLLTTHCLPSTLPAACYLLPATCCLPPTVCYPYDSLLTTRYLLRWAKGSRLPGRVSR